MVRKAGNNVFEAYRQLCLMCGTSDQEGSTGLFVQIMTYKFGSKIEDVEDRLNEFLDVLDMSAHHGLQFPMVSSSNVDAVAAKNVALHEQWKTNFDPDHI